MVIEGKIENMNVGDDYFNCNVITAECEKYNIKLTKVQASKIKINRVYVLEVEEVVTTNYKTQYHLVAFSDLFDSIDDPLRIKEKLMHYYDFSELPVNDVKQKIESYLNRIENKVIKDVTTNIYNRHKKDFYIFPAAVRFHHAYIGGLSHHTKTMLRLAEGMLEVYDFINKDLVYAGIILHDLCKVVELSGFEAEEYTKEGQLIGHLVLISQELILEADKLGYKETEEVLMLNHILLSHHGLPNYGSARRPQTAEALLVWYIDTIDSKFAVIGQELNEIKEGEFTGNISVADRLKFYKNKIK